MKYRFPPDTRLYCRTCTRLTVHNEVAGQVECGVCKRTVHTAELVTIYATDTDYSPGEFLFPVDLLAPLAYAMRFQRKLEAPEEEVALA